MSSGSKRVSSIVIPEKLALNSCRFFAVYKKRISRSTTEGTEYTEGEMLRGVFNVSRSFKNLGVLGELGGKKHPAQRAKRGTSTTEVTEDTEGKLLLKNQISKRSIQERLSVLGALGGKKLPQQKTKRRRSTTEGTENTEGEMLSRVFNVPRRFKKLSVMNRR